MSVQEGWWRDDTPGPRDPPHSFQLEQALLGGILVNNMAFWKVAEFLKVEHFSDPLHGRIFDACARYIERNQVADARTIGALFKGDETLMKAQKPFYVQQLAASAIHIADVSDYGRQIEDLYLRRVLIDVGETIVNDAHRIEASTPATALIDQAEAALYSATASGRADDRLRDSRGSMTDTFNAIQEAVRENALPDNERRARRIVSGLEGLDEVLTMRRGDLVVVAGASSMGKSAFVDCIAEANEENGVTTAIFSLEMPGVAWQQRRLTRRTGIAQRGMVRGDLSQEQMALLMDARRSMEERRCFIDDRPDLTPSRLRAALRRLKRQYNIGLAVVDYIQLMASDQPYRRDQNRVQDVSQITRALKLAASELDICIVAASQINRSVNNKDDKRPDLMHLRESGSIEQDADSVLFVFREEYYLSQQQPGEKASAQEKLDAMARLEACKGLAEIIIGKQRHGEARITRRCRWDGSRTQFSDLVVPSSAQGDLGVDDVP